MLKLVKEVVKLGMVMFAGQLVFEGLYSAYKAAKTRFEEKETPKSDVASAKKSKQPVRSKK